MRRIALSEAPKTVADLVAEAERTGEAIVFTRDGEPAAMLERVQRIPSDADRATAIAGFAALREAISARGIEGWPATWEELKSWAEDRRD